MWRSVQSSDVAAISEAEIPSPWQNVATYPAWATNARARDLRVLMVITSLQIGGAETQTVHLAERLQDAGWSVTVVSLLPLFGHAERIRRREIPVHTLGMKRRLPDPRAIFRLAAIIRDAQPDVVHSHMVHANLLTRLTQIIAPSPVVISTAHNTRETSERGGPTWHKELAYRLTDRLATRTTIICETARRHYIATGAAPADRIEVIPIGVDCSRFTPQPSARASTRASLGLNEEFVWLIAARLVKAKDIPNLFHALKLIEGHNWKLLIAGDGPLRQELEQLAATVCIGQQVSFLGIRSDLPMLLQAADAFVLSSALEGLPVALLEACAAGLPSVVTNVGGASEAVINGISGFVVPPHDPVSLGKAIEKIMLLSPEQRLAFGQSAREHCLKRFELSTIVSSWQDLYIRLLPPERLQKKVLYVITLAERGGSQVHVEDLMANAPAEWIPMLATGQTGFLTYRAEELGIPTRILTSLRQPIAPFHDFRALLQLIKLIRNEKPSLIHAHTSKAGLLGRLAGALTKTPVVFTAHTWSFADGVAGAQKTISLPLEKLTGKLNSKVIAVSNANAELALAHSVIEPSRLVTIWNGMPDTPLRANPGSNRKLRIVMVARFAAQKNHSLLLKACAQVSTQSPWELLLVGDGVTRESMEQLAGSLGIQEQVRFLGNRSDVAPILARCDLFVLSTNWEGLPLSILEAMRAGLPVITTEVGGCAEAVTQGVNGYLTTRDDVVELRDRIKELLTSRQLLQSMGRAGRARFEQDFTLEAMLRKTWSVYESEAPELGIVSSLSCLGSRLQAINQKANGAFVTPSSPTNLFPEAEVQNELLLSAEVRK